MRGRRLMRAGVGVAVGAVVAATAVAGQRQRQPDPDLYHWVLPADHPGVEVATLHPNDCYVVSRAGGVAYFGTPTPALSALQQQLTIATAHVVDAVGADAECTRSGCIDLPRLTAAFRREMNAANPRQTRAADHRPTPADSFYGGAYTDVGSADRERFLNAPEQRMVARHLATSRRGNCYAARAPRTLTVHVRDAESRPGRTGVYHGYLYVEHHHREGRIAD